MSTPEFGPEAESKVGERHSAQGLEELVEQGHASSEIPSEVYELMAAVINFAQDLNEEWLRANFGRP
jgi:type III secretion system FlhB-like substrate exporter